LPSSLGGHGTPEFHFHSVLAPSQEFLYPKIPLDPHEEQLDLPAIFEQSCNGKWWLVLILHSSTAGMFKLSIVSL